MQTLVDTVSVEFKRLETVDLLLVRFEGLVDLAG